MKLYEICFSPTGGTKKVTDILAEALHGESVPVDLTDPRGEWQQAALCPEDVALIAVPSYGGRAPAVALERLSKIRGSGARAVLVCVYGNRAYEDTLVELRDAAAEAGFCIIAAVSAVAEHSIAREVAQGRPDAEDKAQLTAFAEKIRAKISEEGAAEPTIPGNRPYKKRGNSSMVPKPTQACVQCGLCAQQCPVQAIDRENAAKVEGKTCISCMRCVSVCPHAARKLNAMLQAGAGAMLKKVCAGRKTDELFL